MGRRELGEGFFERHAFERALAAMGRSPTVLLQECPAPLTLESLHVVRLAEQDCIHEGIVEQGQLALALGALEAGLVKSEALNGKLVIHGQDLQGRE